VFLSISTTALAALAWQERWKSDRAKGRGGGSVKIDDDGWIMERDDRNATAPTPEEADGTQHDNTQPGRSGNNNNDDDSDDKGHAAAAAASAAANTSATASSSRAATGAHASSSKKSGKVPRIYYATRTHSQIAQVVRELKRTPYRPSMVVLGRDPATHPL